jgi:hypothetical protein
MRWPRSNGQALTKLCYRFNHFRRKNKAKMALQTQQNLNKGKTLSCFILTHLLFHPGLIKINRK